MKLNSKIYYCSHCRKITDNPQSLLFVEDGAPRGFCSENCIEKYFGPLIHFYDNQVSEIRTSLNIVDEEFSSIFNDPRYMEPLFSSPDEIWKLENELHDETYSFIKKLEKDGQDLYVFCLCYVLNHSPSFILHISASRSQKMRSFFQIGKKIDDISAFLARPSSTKKALQIDEGVVGIIESKKSRLLADLMEKRSSADIRYEDFHLYLEFYQSTLESPDEIYHVTDVEGDELYTYIKSHHKQGIAFYYIVLCALFPDKDNSEKNVAWPVLSFPSLDAALYQKYKKGNLISGSGNLKN